MWIWSITFFKGCSLCYCDAIYRRAILFACSMNHIPPCLLLSRADDDDVRNNGQCDFRSVLIHPLLSDANFSIAVFTAEAAGKASFVHSCMWTRLKVDSMKNNLLAWFVSKLMITVPRSIDHVKRPRSQI